MQYIKFLIVLSSVFMMSGLANGAEFYLRAERFTKTINGDLVPMWGFSQSTDGGTNYGSPTVPGPELVVPVGDTSLTIHLANLDILEEVSILIPGQRQDSMIPTTKPLPGGGAPRMFSLTQDVAMGASATYVWSSLKPGTYLYESASHQAAQVQMGLYGAMIHDHNAGVAYDNHPGWNPAAGAPPFLATYDESRTLLFSEIDPVQHAAIDGGTFTSAVLYNPKYFLINGEPYDGVASSELGTGWSVPGQGPNVLLRMLNAGYQTYLPVLNGRYFDIISDDGNILPYIRTQYSVELHAQKTHDAILSLGCDNAVNPSYNTTNLVLHERRGNMSTSTPDGMLVHFTLPDGDGDYVPEFCDSCITLAGFIDTNNDGFGNICDPDLDGSLLVNFGDFAAFVNAFFGAYNPDADFNTDGYINFGDLGTMASLFGGAPGPSGLVP